MSLRRNLLPVSIAALVLAGCGQEAAAPVQVAAPAPAPAEPVAAEPSERERAAIARFEPQGDGALVLDRATGLTWMRCSIGQEWTGETCAGEAERHDWDAAVALADAFEYAGHADWRLPTRDELLTITWCSSGHRFATDADGAGGACAGSFRQPAILSAVFPATPALKFWSATPGTMSFTAWGVAFSTAVTGAGNRRDSEHLRLVRGAQYQPAAK
ncbi:DUF1566 domain-containing protein [Thauera sp. CAU 1555]|uniref:DUF1566 domain-containing protein n=1 Tax=Thauera sedimentorum TaxID=2767595 RepID=A0ABR9B843_9RHOO|nr:DUF1566 domain-containing protein [Thauera sedimentorum]MBC9071605.1 DUF1566 domain-containing protein [Thauera sedimentorum]MBD8502524.1 DUF1566 domain-containing protein [Thauera sedimentorum]